MTELGIDVRNYWKCPCGHKQDAVDDEEWPSHCGKLMQIGVTWQLIPLPAPETNPVDGEQRNGKE